MARKKWFGQVITSTKRYSVMGRDRFCADTLAAKSRQEIEEPKFFWQVSATKEVWMAYTKVGDCIH